MVFVILCCKGNVGLFGLYIGDKLFVCLVYFVGKR